MKAQIEVDDAIWHRVKMTAMLYKRTVSSVVNELLNSWALPEEGLDQLKLPTVEDIQKIYAQTARKKGRAG